MSKHPHGGPLCGQHGAAMWGASAAAWPGDNVIQPSVPTTPVLHKWLCSTYDEAIRAHPCAAQGAVQHM